MTSEGTRTFCGEETGFTDSDPIHRMGTVLLVMRPVNNSVTLVKGPQNPVIGSLVRELKGDHRSDLFLYISINLCKGRYTFGGDVLSLGPFCSLHFYSLPLTLS